jgi:polyhydroxyalkanoate synthesis regulator protein
MDAKSLSDSVSQLGIRGVVPTDKMMGDEPEDTALLVKLRDSASNYLLSFPWCVSIVETYYGDGVGGIVGVFLFRLLSARADIDEWLWVVVGDLPPAYFVTDDLKSPYEVLEAYIMHRSRWVKFAMEGTAPPGDVMPIEEVPPTPDWAKDLQSRLDTLREHILPSFRNQ